MPGPLIERIILANISVPCPSRATARCNVNSSTSKYVNIFCPSQHGVTWIILYTVFLFIMYFTLSFHIGICRRQVPTYLKNSPQNKNFHVISKLIDETFVTLFLSLCTSWLVRKSIYTEIPLIFTNRSEVLPLSIQDWEFSTTNCVGTSTESNLFVVWFLYLSS